MHDEGELDLTSEPLLRPLPPLPPNGKPRRQTPPSMRVLFKCCRVYANVPIPAAVHSGQLSSWRFHCPRCGQLVEIPLTG